MLGLRSKRGLTLAMLGQAFGEHLGLVPFGINAPRKGSQAVSNGSRFQMAQGLE